MECPKCKNHHGGKANPPNRGVTKRVMVETVFVGEVGYVKPSGTFAPSSLNMRGQDHQGDEAVSVTVPVWKPNMAFCKLRIVMGESPKSISGM